MQTATSLVAVACPASGMLSFDPSREIADFENPTANSVENKFQLPLGDFAEIYKTNIPIDGGSTLFVKIKLNNCPSYCQLWFEP